MHTSTNKKTKVMTRDELEKDVEAAKKRLENAPVNTPAALLKQWQQEYDYLVFRLDNLYDDVVNEFTE